MTVLNMMPREHHFTFSQRVLPSELFKDPQRFLAELCGPMGGTFLFYLWEQVGKVVSESLKHADVGALPGNHQPPAMLKLDVAGIARDGHRTFVLVTLPPTRFPGEAMFGAVVQDGPRARYFAFERNAGIASLGENPDSAYLAEYLPDGTRVSHGAQAGTDGTAFTRAVCSVLGMSFDVAWPQIRQGVADPVSAGAFGPLLQQGSGRLQGIGGFLSALILGMIAWPIVMRIAGGLFYSIVGPSAMNGLHSLLSLTTTVTLIVWSYRLFAGLPGKRDWSPAMAVLAWFIPVANFVLPGLVMRSGWRAVSGGQGGGLALLWWALHLLTIGFSLFFSGLGPMLVEPVQAATFFMAMSWLSTFTTLAAYGLLLFIVKDVTRKA